MSQCIYAAADDRTAENSMMMMMMSSSPATSISYDDSDLLMSSSTGYLEDVLFQLSSSSSSSSSNKRRRLLMMPPADHHHFYRSSSHDDDLIDTSLKSCWASDLIQDFDDTLSEITKCDMRINSDMKRSEAVVTETYYDSCSSSHKESGADNNYLQLQCQYWSTPEKENLYCSDHHYPIFSSGAHDEKRKKRLLAKVVYPFALVKPGGFEGDMTLNDINERILMPPTRPVRHPVGDFACRPMVSPDGPGLSGKAVVAFTRIHTQGRGTITIVRTRG